MLVRVERGTYEITATGIAALRTGPEVFTVRWLIDNGYDAPTALAAGPGPDEGRRRVAWRRRSDAGVAAGSTPVELAQRPLAVRVGGWRLPFFYGWVIAGVGFVVNMLFGAMMFHSFGTYVVLLREEFGWSLTSFSLAFALMRVESGLLGPIEGWAIDRVGPRAIMRVGVILFGVGLILLSQIQSLLTFYLVFLLMALGSALGAFLPISVAIVNWFDRRRATALAILSLGFSAGGLIQPLVVWGLETLGWRQVSVIAGLIALIVGLPLTQLVRHRPEDHGYHPDGVSAEEARAHAPRADASFTTRQALRTQAFWMLSLGQSASMLVFGAVSVHFVAHMHDGLGFSLGTAAGAITVMTVAMVVGQLVFGGFLGDRMNKKLVICVAMWGNTLAMVLLALGTTLWIILVFAIVNGLAMGTRGPLMQALRADYFGRGNFGTIMGFSSLVMMFGIVSGPLLAGLSYDVLGEYRPAFLLLAAMSTVGSVFFMFARKPAAHATPVPPATPAAV